MTIAVNFFTPTTGASSTLTSTTVTVNSNDIILILTSIADDTGHPPNTPTNSGTALTWTLIKDSGDPVSDFCRVWGYWARGDAGGNRTITQSWTGSITACIYPVQISGASTSSGVVLNAQSSFNTANLSLAMTPNSTNSALLACLGDFNASNTLTAGSNCTLVNKTQQAGQQTSGLLRPTAEPLGSTANFTMASTGSSQILAWIAFEVIPSSGGVSFTWQDLIGADEIPMSMFRREARAHD